MAEDKQVAVGGGAPTFPLVDLSRPRYDQSTFGGRLKYFFETANPLNIFVSNRRLEEARKLVIQYNKSGVAPPGTTEEKLWEAKRLYDSAYHPDTGKKMFWVGRMSAQVPMNMTIVGSMMTFYRTPAAVIFWQWINQSFNATVNYTNRSGNELFTMRQLMVPYVAATGAATATALTLNQIIARVTLSLRMYTVLFPRPSLLFTITVPEIPPNFVQNTQNLFSLEVERMPPLIGRFVPFAAVAAANAINIPLMRQNELRTGIPVLDENDNEVGLSKKAAQKAIVQVTISRICMAMPGMMIPPFFMHALERRHVFKRMPWLNAPLQIFMVGFCLVFATPICCAIFPQKSSIAVSRLEPEVQESIKKTSPHLTTVYYNKGL